MKIMKTYYSNFKNGTATCNLCLKVIKTSGNTTNMASHMKNKHYDVFAKCNQNNEIVHQILVYMPRSPILSQ
ncbi:uncharacterized protein LOC116804676 isoform X3 [Drosophila mojavensis]|uniref:uncharacterized protein LOC116804676 isoform X3 n=1 Tax=Drosophila mojavensis TaxID=7230 RepID=UPI0013EEC60E|nr:uncharacterized protein LOC116804676 isoform X3 [Drosophila mojavensis]